jgi:hypothetical protein
LLTRGPIGNRPAQPSNTTRLTAVRGMSGAHRQFFTIERLSSERLL